LNTYREFLAHPHTAACGAIAWVAHPAVAQPVPLPNLTGLPPFVSGEARTLAPSLGEHSGIILREHGFPEAEIADLAIRQVIRVPDVPTP
jgi:crotonobetainyl-CoA:carnitine CoA-transferase CaiB-like acyl-CoA transferase